MRDFNTKKRIFNYFVLLLAMFMFSQTEAVEYKPSLRLQGEISFEEQTTDPDTLTGYGSVYAKDDKDLYFKDSDGNVFNVLVSGGVGGAEIDDLFNVTSAPESDGDFLIYNTTTSKWESKSLRSDTLRPYTADGVSVYNGSGNLVATFDGSPNPVTELLGLVKLKAIQSSSGTVTIKDDAAADSIYLATAGGKSAQFLKEVNMVGDTILNYLSGSSVTAVKIKNSSGGDAYNYNATAESHVYTGGTSYNIDTSNFKVNSTAQPSGAIEISNADDSITFRGDLKFDTQTISSITTGTADNTALVTQGYVDDGDEANADALALSAGCYDCDITDNGDGTITLAASTVNLFSTTDYTGKINQYSVSGGTSGTEFTALADNDTNYVLVDYNAGTPVFQITNVNTSVNNSNIVEVYRIFRSGLNLHIVDEQYEGKGLANKIDERLRSVERFSRESGVILEEVATRDFKTSAGVVWFGAAGVSLNEAQCSVDLCLQYYRDTGAWTYSSVTQYNNTQYDDGTDLVELTPNRYAVNWIYRGVETDEHLYFVLGDGDYTLAEALESQPPEGLPEQITSHGYLVGRIIVQASDTTAYAVQSSFDVSFSNAGVSDHGDLAGLGDDDHNQYTLLSGRSGDTLNIEDIQDFATAGIDILNNTGTTIATFGATDSTDTDLKGSLDVANDSTFNSSAGDNDFAILKQTSGNAFLYDAGLDLFTASADFVFDTTGYVKVATGTEAQRPGTPSAGMLRFNSDIPAFEGYDGTTWGEIGGGGATGSPTTLQFFVADDNETTDLITGNNASFNGGGTITASSITKVSTPLKTGGEESFKYAPSANGSNDYFGVELDNIYKPDINKAQEITINYKTVNASDGDFTLNVAQYDATDTLIGTIQSVDVDASTDAKELPYSFYLADDVSYIRYGFQNTSTATNIELYFDKFVVDSALGDITLYNLTDSETYTPTTQGLGSITADDVRYWRVGNTLKLQAKFTTGTTSATEAQFGLPNGLTIDDNNSAGIKVVGYGNRGGTSNAILSVLATPGDSFLNFGGANSAAETDTALDGSVIFASATTYYVNAEIPIEGWQATTEATVTQGSKDDVGEIIPSIRPFTDAPKGTIATNGLSVGNTGSGADKTGSQYKNLYEYMWSMDGLTTTAGNPYVISAAKGATFQDDWDAGKTITIDFVTNPVYLRQADGSVIDLGGYHGDAFQGHWHEYHSNINVNTGTTSTYAAVPLQIGLNGALAAPDRIETSSSPLRDASQDETNGTPRTASETRTKATGVNFFIRYTQTAVNVIMPKYEKQYDLTVTGTNWTTAYAVATVERKIYKGEVTWWLTDLLINGSLSSTTSANYTLTVAGVVFKDTTFPRTPLTRSLQESGVAYRTAVIVGTDNGASTITIADVSGAWDLLKMGGSVELASKPSETYFPGLD